MVDDPLEVLFTVAPEKFTATRDALVKRMRAEKRKDEATVVASLRRPTAGVWAMNQVVRAHPDAVDELLAVGREALAAQNALLRGGTIDAFNAAVERRRDIVSALVNQTLAVLTSQGIAVDQLATPLRSAYEFASIDAAVGSVLQRGQLTSLPAPNEDTTPVTFSGASPSAAHLPVNSPSAVKSHLRLVPDLPTESPAPPSHNAAPEVGVPPSVRSGAEQTEIAVAEERRLKQAEENAKEKARLAAMRVEWESVLAAANADAAGAVAELNHLQVELDSLTTGHLEAEHEQREARQKRVELEELLTELDVRLADLDRQLTALAVRKPVVETALVAVQQRIAELGEQVATAEHALVDLAELANIAGGDTG